MTKAELQAELAKCKEVRDSWCHEFVKCRDALHAIGKHICTPDPDGLVTATIRRIVDDALDGYDCTCGATVSGNPHQVHCASNTEQKP